MNGTSKNRSECLTAAETLAYANRELEATALGEVESHLDACRLCSDAVLGVLGWEDRGRFRTTVDSLNARVRARARKRETVVPTLRQFLALAASLVLGMGTAFYVFHTPAHEALFQEQFEPYPSTMPVVRGEAPRDALSEALWRYESGEYTAALRGLEKVLAEKPEEPAALFYYSLSKLSLGEPRESVSGLQKVLALARTDFTSPARWYLALSYVRLNDRTKARRTLEEIASGEDFYRDRALALIEKLK